MISDQDLIVACPRAYREHKKTLPASPLRFVSLGDLETLPTATDRAEALLENPVRNALKGQVRDIGWRTFTCGGINAMHALMDQVEQALPECATWAGGTLDKWWSGIGSKAGGVWEA